MRRDDQRAGAAQADRLPIRPRAGHLLHAHDAAGAGAVVEHQRLAERGAQPGFKEPCDGVGRPAGRKGNDDAQGLLLREGGGCEEWQDTAGDHAAASGRGVSVSPTSGVATPSGRGISCAFRVKDTMV